MRRLDLSLTVLKGDQNRGGYGAHNNRRLRDKSRSVGLPRLSSPTNVPGADSHLGTLRFGNVSTAKSKFHAIKIPSRQVLVRSDNSGLWLTLGSSAFWSSYQKAESPNVSHNWQLSNMIIIPQLSNVSHIRRHSFVIVRLCEHLNLETRNIYICINSVSISQSMFLILMWYHVESFHRTLNTLRKCKRLHPTMNIFENNHVLFYH